MDNLDSQTYEIFEKDPIKYVQYEKVNSSHVYVTCMCTATVSVAWCMCMHVHVHVMYNVC